MVRTIAWMLAGGLAVGAVGVAMGWIDLGRVPLLGRVFGSKERHGAPEPAPAEPERPRESQPLEFETRIAGASAPTDPSPSPAARCCVDRQQLGAATLFEIQDALEKRWPKLERIGSDQIVVGDRVAFLIEIGSDPESFERELRTGFVAALDERSLTVELDPLAGAGMNPNEGARMIIPRGAVLGWSRANAPQRRVAIEWTAKPDDEGLFVRHVEIGQPITLAIPEHRAGLRWSIEPAAANFRVLGVDANNLAQVVFDRGSRSGRFHVRLHADDPGWGSTAIGHWAFQLRGVS